MTLASKLNKALTTKTEIKTAIEKYGVEVISEKFADYPAYIADIINHIEAGGIEIVGAVNRQVKLGETLSAGAVIDVVGNVWGISYKKTNDVDIMPSSYGTSCAMSADGQFLAVGIYGGFVTYKWSAINSRYEKTNSPDIVDFSSGVYACAMSADGHFLFVASRYGRSYKWSEANNRYEKTANPTYNPTGYTYGASMSADGQFLAAPNGNSPYLYTFKWSEANNRYETTNNPDIAPGGGKSCAMSADGQFLAAAANSALPYLSTFKWSEANNRYEKTNNPDVDPGGGNACAMSADGQFLAVGHLNASSSPAYLTTYKWSEANNRYEKTNNPDFAPSGAVSGVGISADGTYLVASHAGTVPPAGFVTYKWSVENARYERAGFPDVAPPRTPSGNIGMSSDGVYCAVAFDIPSYLITYKLNIAGHDLKAYASQNKMWRMNSHYTGVLSAAGEVGDIVVATMLTKTPGDPLEVFGPNPGEE